MEPIAYCKRLEGKSNAHLIQFDDGQSYVVKYFQPGFEKTLPNEWLAYCLGRYLGVPIPFSKIIDIPATFSSQVPELSDMSTTPYQFASLYIPDCKDAHQVTNLSGITNHKALAATIVFDYWFYNGDRTRKNVLLHEELENTYQLWAIDHAEVFGTYNWNLLDLPTLPTGLIKSATHEMMARFIDNESQFLQSFEQIQTIPIFLIEEIVSMIPDEWMVTKEERKEMVGTLLHRRKKVLPKVIPQFIKKIYLPLHTNKT
ncbi:HipA family kinase [Niallia sp. Krafla_26]|uniref:HipA family kinase n=1 Tax=Niallia sp. Krafla_26 TaxID=3064703 RepID=UPI003D170EC8